MDKIDGQKSWPKRMASKKHVFFCLKSVWDFQKWTKKMSKNRKSQNSLEKTRKNFSVTIKNSYGLTPKK